jgi:hypothetical protein
MNLTSWGLGGTIEAGEFAREASDIPTIHVLDLDDQLTHSALKSYCL